MSVGFGQPPPKPLLVARRFLCEDFDSGSGSLKPGAFKCKSRGLERVRETELSVTGWDEWADDPGAAKRLCEAHPTTKQIPGVCIVATEEIEALGLKLKWVEDPNDAEFGAAHWNIDGCPTAEQQDALVLFAQKAILCLPRWRDGR
jgi:hypothetical protein